MTSPDDPVTSSPLLPSAPASQASGEEPRSKWPRRLKRAAIALLVLALLGWLALPSVLRAIPGLLEERHAPAKAQAIVVLAGDHTGARVDAALALVREGWLEPSGRFLVSGGELYPGTTWAQVMQERAVAGGVPRSQIVLQDRSTTTAEDAAFSLAELDLPAGSTLLLVTSASHSGRALRHFRQAAGERFTILSCPAPAPEGDWWHDAVRTRALATEVLKRLWPGPGG